MDSLGEGILPYKRYTGTCRPNEIFFHMKSLNMGPIFYKIIPKYESVFQNFSRKIPKNGSIFFKKSLNMGTLFLKIYPKDGLGV